MPVLELRTSQRCSAYPPADQWLSTLKGQPVVAHAFHVGYGEDIEQMNCSSIAALAERPRPIKRGVSTPKAGTTLQTVSLSCR